MTAKKKVEVKPVPTPVNEPEVIPEVVKTEPTMPIVFINMTKRNIFTTEGRVGPKETILLHVTEGEATEGLGRA